MDPYLAARNRALTLGAVKEGIYHTLEGLFPPRREPFSAHFFLADGREVGYFNFIIEGRLTELMPPREWGEDALSDLTFSDLSVRAHWKQVAHDAYALVHKGTTKHFDDYAALYAYCVANNINATQT